MSFNITSGGDASLSEQTSQTVLLQSIVDDGANKAQQQLQTTEQVAINTKLTDLLTEIYKKAKVTDTQPVALAKESIDAGGALTISNKTTLGSYV